ncbi:HAMP domain-containing sensor histidine kinase [Sulfuricurvum sp.]|uniref:sensor histidine kinase n=1 Tax=Sulfuricurvum sp. TaxID=2025608 RepID=UPI002635BC58|nr:HAMP domain-containing sensor histidine kinase [Sulfuricurvum sp.]MDD2266858.1 HAMP domain-containing sensor histidine kinase [Sulfuricurvum sp.]MDD2783837.1 HAMP domain-containing sensor histidine kinase [Sulfuricurvum sp.]
MIVDEKKFVRRYSLIYTCIVSVILLAPLYFYVKHKINMQEVRTEVELKSIQSHIINAMDSFGNNPDGTFEFPKFNSYQSGLYSNTFSTIYSQIKEPLPSFMPGYHSEGLSRFLITALPPQKYFFADYLITETTISYTDIFLEASIIAFGILVLILLLSFYFLNSFSVPFKRVNEKLDEFIKESMHEMNTPLSIINVNVDLFNSIYESNKYLSRIKSATKSLATIYNDMDYLIKQNRIEYKDELIDFEAFVKERVEYFELICQLNNITLSLHADTRTHIRFNPTKLQRIVDNTLSNAIKFSHKNGKIDVYIHKNENGGISLVVQDYGQGIKHPEKITNPYYREHEHKTGFGIGMNIVKSIIDKSDITLDIQSTYLKGSTFTYTFNRSLVVNSTEQKH